MSQEKSAANSIILDPFLDIFLQTDITTYLQVL